MTTADAGGDRRTDGAVRAALQRIVVPDHGPHFWDHLGRRLADEAGTGAGAGGAPPDDPAAARPVGPDHGGGAPTGAAYRPHPLAPEASNGVRPPAHRLRRPRRPLLAAAAVILIVVAAAAALLLPADDRSVEVRSGDAEVTEPPATRPAPTSTSPGTAPTSTAVTPSPGGEAAVLGFLDALGSGDLAGAAARLGPRSEAYLDATAGSVEDFLGQAAEGYGAWAAVTDRTTTTIPLSSGEVVVVVSGQLPVEGTVEDRTDAFPATYAESAGAWFVEPWALDPARGGQLTVRTPPPDIGGGPPPTVDRIDRVVATAVGEGAIWLAIDDAPPRRTTVGPDLEATWALTEPLPAGRHLLTVIFRDDTVFTATATSYVVAP